MLSSFKTQDWVAELCCATAVDTFTECVTMEYKILYYQRTVGGCPAEFVMYHRLYSALEITITEYAARNLMSYS